MHRIPARRHAVRPLDIAHWVFCTDEGECYVEENGRTTNFNSVWKRFMDRLLKETRVTERFAERDIRAKVASDAETLEKGAPDPGKRPPKATTATPDAPPDGLTLGARGWRSDLTNAFRAESRA
jgi:hypothetical protein